MKKIFGLNQKPLKKLKLGISLKELLNKHGIKIVAGITFILANIIFWQLFVHLDSSTKQLKFTDSNDITHYYLLATVTHDRWGLLENVDVFIPADDPKSEIIINNSLTDGCRIIGKSTSGLQINCNKIYENGFLKIYWEQNTEYRSYFGRFKIRPIKYYADTKYPLKIPFYSLQRIIKKGSVGQHHCPEPYTPIQDDELIQDIIRNSIIYRLESPHTYTIDSIDWYIPVICRIANFTLAEFKPIRSFFYSNSIAILKFSLAGQEKGKYTFLTRWRNSTGDLVNEYKNEGFLNEYNTWWVWFYNPVDHNKKWTADLVVIGSETINRLNTSFRIKRNDEMTPYLELKNCKSRNDTIIIDTLRNMSLDSNDEFTQAADILKMIRAVNIYRDSYKMSLEFTKRARSIGIPTRMLRGENDIGFENYWTEIYFSRNNSWIPIEPSSEYDIGKISSAYKKNITILYPDLCNS